jgi:hypothetical protein
MRKRVSEDEAVLAQLRLFVRGRVGLEVDRLPDLWEACTKGESEIARMNRFVA